MSYCGAGISAEALSLGAGVSAAAAESAGGPGCVALESFVFGTCDAGVARLALLVSSGALLSWSDTRSAGAKGSDAACVRAADVELVAGTACGRGGDGWAESTADVEFGAATEYARAGIDCGSGRADVDFGGTRPLYAPPFGKGSVCAPPPSYMTES